MEFHRMSQILLLPILIPLLTAILSLLAWRRPALQRLLSLAGAAALLFAGLGLFTHVWKEGIQAVQVGNWPAPFGITLAADLLSASMVVLTGLAGLATAVYSLAGMDRQRESFGYYPLLHVLLMGVSGSFLTGDIFNLYVWFEVLLIASFVLLGLGSEKTQLEGTLKYVTLNLISSALFLAAIGMLYGVVGTLNLADLALQMQSARQPALIFTLSMLFLIAFGIKAAIFPLFFWLPASYHTPPAAVSAIFAGLLTKVGVYALIRVFSLMFAQDMERIRPVLLTLAALTLLTGILGALVQKDFRRILSFNLVSHIGYLIMGLGLMTPLALAGTIFYMFHDVIAKTNLFLFSGVIHRMRNTYRITRLGGFYASHPGLSILFLIPALSLAGVPPLSGFWGKLVLVQAGLAEGQYLLVAVALGVGLLTLLSMGQIWAEVFWKDAPIASESESAGAKVLEPGPWLLFLIPMGALALLTCLMGLFPQPVLKLATQAAGQLIYPEAYIRTVLGGRP